MCALPLRVEQDRQARADVVTPPALVQDDSEEHSALQRRPRSHHPCVLSRQPGVGPTFSTDEQWRHDCSSTRRTPQRMGTLYSVMQLTSATTVSTNQDFPVPPPPPELLNTFALNSLNEANVLGEQVTRKEINTAGAAHSVTMRANHCLPSRDTTSLRCHLLVPSSGGGAACTKFRLLQKIQATLAPDHVQSSIVAGVGKNN